jgi:hypothetical protein
MDAHVQGKKHLDKLQQQLHPRKEMDDSRKVGDFLKTLFEIPIQIELKGPF